jgi:type IV pilus assembly protein PilV
MLKKPFASGFTLLEVLIAILITAFGLLGLAGLMSRMQVAETEGYASSEATALVWDMSERLYAGAPATVAAANAYTNAGTTATVGTGATGYTSPCTGTGAALDLCEWHFALLGAAETRGSTKVGAMSGAVGCVKLVAAPDPTPGTCHPAIFRVTVAWQGFVDSADQSTNANTCGSGNFGNEKRRRMASQLITVGSPGCTN